MSSYGASTLAGWLKDAEVHVVEALCFGCIFRSVVVFSLFHIIIMYYYLFVVDLFYLDFIEFRFVIIQCLVGCIYLRSSSFFLFCVVEALEYNNIDDANLNPLPTITDLLVKYDKDGNTQKVRGGRIVNVIANIAKAWVVDRTFSELCKSDHMMQNSN